MTCSAYPLAAIDSIGPNGEHSMYNTAYYACACLFVEGQNSCSIIYNAFLSLLNLFKGLSSVNTFG